MTHLSTLAPERNNTETSNTNKSQIQHQARQIIHFVLNTFT